MFVSDNISEDKYLSKHCLKLQAFNYNAQHTLRMQKILAVGLISFYLSCRKVRTKPISIFLQNIHQAQALVFIIRKKF